MLLGVIFFNVIFEYLTVYTRYKLLLDMAAYEITRDVLWEKIPREEDPTSHKSI